MSDDGVKVEIRGLKEVKAKLAFLGGDGGRKIYKSALRRAAKVVAEAAADNARRVDDSETGRSIADNVGFRFSTRYLKQTGNPKIRIGILGGAKFPNGKVDKAAGAATPHWRLLEFGTSNAAARPFFRPAIDENVSAALDEFVRAANKAVDSALKRKAKALTGG